MRNPFRQIKRKSLVELCDEFLALLGPYDHNHEEVWNLKHRLGRLMYKHNILSIARKDTLIEREYICAHTVKLLPLDRLGRDVFSENTEAAHLIPLVDRLLEADGGRERHEQLRKAVAIPLARIAKAEGRSKDFIYQGYKFHWAYWGGMSAWVSVDPVADFDG